MKFTASQVDLAQGLALAAKAVSSRNTLPILSGILIKSGEHRLKLAATNLEIGIVASVPAQIEEPGEVVLPARYLTEIVRRLPMGTVQVEVDPNNFTALIRWDKSQYTIHGSSAEQFPYLPESGDDSRLTMEQSQLRTMIRQTAFAVSHDETRPVLTGASFNFAPPQIEVLATDGVRIAYRRGQLESSTGSQARVVIPGRTLSELSRLLSDEAGKKVEISLAQNQVFFDLDGVRLISRLIEGQYPEVFRLIPDEFGTSLRLSTQVFLETCERAELITRDGNNALKLSINPEKLVVTSNTPEIGQVYEEVAATVEGSSLDIGLNPRFLIEGLRSIDSEEIIFQFNGNRTPTRMKPAGNDDYLYVVLPIVVW